MNTRSASLPLSTQGISKPYEATRDVHYKDDTKAALRLPKDIWSVAKRKLDMLDDAKDLRDLNTKGNRLEKLKGDRKAFWSIRTNDQYRIVFKWWDRRVATASFRP